MGSDSIPLWILFFICVVGGAYFAATESSFSAVNKIKIKTMADDGNKRAKGVMYVINKFDKALTTLLIGNNVTKIAGASVFTILATEIFREAFGKSQDFLDSFAFSMICSVMSTVIIFLFSEMDSQKLRKRQKRNGLACFSVISSLSHEGAYSDIGIF